MSEIDNNIPIDLSRRNDSVETRKTPSPSNSSSFHETSPSLENDSPKSIHIRKNMRSDTPTNHHQQPNEYMLHGYPSRNYPKQERITPSPPEPMPMHHHHQHHHHQYLHDSVRFATDKHMDVRMNPYYINALKNQRKFLNGSSSPENETLDSSQYSMDLNHERSFSRPFKLSAKDSLNLTTTMPTSSDQYDVFRQQMLSHLYPNGEPTGNNSKMRRIARKSYDGSDKSEVDFNQNQNDQVTDAHQQQNDGKSDSSSSGASNSKGLVKDNAYYERRRKNNAAAKKSRDRRRQKEDDLAIRAAFLRQENLQLKFELETLKREMAQQAIRHG